MAEQVTRTITLTGTPELVSLMEAVLAEVQYMGRLGCSRRLAFYVDGDGPDRLQLSPNLTPIGPATDGDDPYGYDTIVVSLDGTWGEP